jgi:phosphohistidine phosphatase
MPLNIILIRHAKSSWNDASQSDFDRPLNERGKEDAPEMGRRLKEAGIIPDLIVASTAKRAQQTARFIAEGVAFPVSGIDSRDELYHAAPPTYENLIVGLDNKHKTVFFVAHNPGISEFAASLDPTHSISHLPTCATVGIRVEADEWSDFHAASKSVFHYDSPKSKNA